MADKNQKSQFFKKTYLLANINRDVAFEISILILSIVKDSFTNQEYK